MFYDIFSFMFIYILNTYIWSTEKGIIDLNLYIWDRV